MQFFFSVNEDNESSAADLDFLKNNDGPFEIILEKWNTSFVERSKILDDKNISTSEYLSLFPIFKLNDNNIFKLVSISFCHNYSCDGNNY